MCQSRLKKANNLHAFIFYTEIKLKSFANQQSYIMLCIAYNQNPQACALQMLEELFVEIQHISQQTLPSEEMLEAVSFQSNERTDGFSKIDETLLNEEESHLGGLQGTELMFSSEIIKSLDGIWNGSNKVNCKQRLFARCLQDQRRSIKSLKENTAQNCIGLPILSADWYRFSLMNMYGQQEIVEFNQEDLNSLKKGTISISIFFNYATILRAANIIPFRTYIFPEYFLERLLGQHFQDYQQTEQALRAYIERNFQTIQSECDVNILDFEYLIIPVLVEESYKCIIIQGANQLNQFSKATIIFCNLLPNVGSMFSKAIRIYLHFAYQHNKRSRLLQNSRLAPQIYLMLPRELNHTDSGLYMMLYVEFLFANKCSELQKIRMPENYKKLHLFPRSLALLSREQILNLFVCLEAETSLRKRREISLSFFEKRSRFCDSAMGQQNYDRIEGRELAKFLAMSDTKHTRNEQALKFEDELNYYLDPELNYYLTQSS